MSATTFAQNVKICDMCKISPVNLHCNSCAANLCKGCISDHISLYTEKDHHVVMFKKKTKPILPICKTHEKQICDKMCGHCDIPVCLNCLASGFHEQHTLIDLIGLYISHKNTIRKHTTELELYAYPKYENVISELEMKLKNLSQTYEKQMSEISNQGEIWHREVDIIINRCKQELEKMKKDELVTLKHLLEEMKNRLSILRRSIIDYNELLQSNNVFKILESKSTSLKIWNPPPSIHLTTPTFNPLPIQGEVLHQMFGTLSPASLPSPPGSIKLLDDKLATALNKRQPFDSLEHLATIHTGYELCLNCVACFSSDQIWVSGFNDGTIKRFTITESTSPQEIIATKTLHMPYSIKVTRKGDLLYTDYWERSINMVRQGMIEKIISLKDWRPLAVCSTTSDDIWIAMEKSYTPSKVVRYSGSKEKQVIQFDNDGKPLFSVNSFLFLAASNEKDMVCVSDMEKNTLVVVHQTGKLRFKYKGDFFQKYKSFSPCGVAIDSMGHILVADQCNDCIHIIDHQGNFIRYIDNCQLHDPYDICLDRNNILYVAEMKTSNVKVIKYFTGPDVYFL